ncbi:hypothetical protein ACSSS7_000595 [Eimeria intestinalis]
MPARDSSMVTLQAAASYEPRLFFRGLDLEWESGTSTSLQGRSRPLHAARHSPYVATSYAVILLSLAVAYLLWGCVRSLHLHSSPVGALRALAARRFRAEACTGELGSSQSDEGAAGSETADRSGEGGSPRSEGGPRARRDAAPFQHRRSSTFVYGWAVQEMPLEWQEKSRRSLHKFRDLALKCALLVDVLPSRYSVALVLHMAALACVELSGFGHVPEALQGVRWATGRAFVLLVERVLKQRKLGMAAIAASSEQSLANIRKLIKEVCRVPPLMEGVTSKRFKELFVRHWELNKRTTQHLGHHFDLLITSSRERGSDFQGQVEMVMHVVKALLETRKLQMLADKILRRWLGTCHKNVGTSVLYTREEYERASREGALEVSAELNQITAVVVQAGGSPVLPSFFSTFPSSLDSPTAREPSSLVFGQATEGVEAHERYHPPAPSQEYSQATSGVGAQQQLSERKEPSLLASMRLVGSQGLPKPAHAKEYYAALGARPRHSASDEMQDAEVNAEAEALGWGPRRMPPQVATQVLLVLDRVERAANTFEVIFPLLSHEEAVLLSMNLARWAATEIASFSLVPSDIEGKRRRVAMRYTALIDLIMEEPGRCQAASHLGVDADLIRLGTLFQELMNSPHEPSDLDARSYMRMVMNAWRLSNYASRCVQGLLGSMWPTRSMRGTPRGKPQVVSPVIAALGKVRVRQLLADFETGGWFETCHEKCTPGVLYTEEEREEARRSGPLSVVRELNRITEVLERAQQSATAAGTPEVFPEVEPGSFSRGEKEVGAPATQIRRQQPSDTGGQLLRFARGPTAGEEVRAPTSLLQTLGAFSFGDHGSSSRVEKGLPRRPPRPSRQQPSGPQRPIPSSLAKAKTGEEARGLTSSPHLRATSTIISESPPPRMQLQLNPLAAEFLPQHLLSQQRQTTRDPTSARQPPIAHPPLPQPAIDSRIGYSQITQRYPPAPPSPAPQVQLPEVYYHMFPQMYQTSDFSTRTSSGGESLHPQMYGSPTTEPHSAYAPQSLHSPQWLRLPTRSVGPPHTFPEGVLQSSEETGGPSHHAHGWSEAEGIFRQPEGAEGGHAITSVTEQFASWRAFLEEDQPGD